MMKKIKESCQISPKAISIATKRNRKRKQFYVESGSGKCYMVSINNTNHVYYHLFQENSFANMRRSPLLTDLLFCECVDWKKHYLPCKHMLAVGKRLKYLGKVFPKGTEILHFSKLILTHLTELMITNKITTLLKVLRQYAIWKRKIVVKMLFIQNYFKNSGRNKQLPLHAGIY